MISYVQPCFFDPHCIVDKTFDELKNAFDAFLQEQSKKLINCCMINIHLVFKMFITYGYVLFILLKLNILESEGNESTNQGITTVACLPEMCYSY